MILIEDLKHIPEFLLTDTSKFERLALSEKHSEFMLKRSFPAKIFIEDDRTLLLAGLFRSSMTAVPHFWALISPALREAKISSVRAIVRYGNETLPGAQTYINRDDPSAVRLAEFFGFEPRDHTFLFEDKIYQTYRRPL